MLRSTPTVGLFAVATGFNTFALGSTYWAIRSTMLRALDDPHTRGRVGFTSKEKVYISGASGALTGAGIGLLFRGRSNVIPGAIVWGLLGLGGQYAYNTADARHTQEVNGPTQEQDTNSGFWDKALRSQWSPVKRLTDQEYEKMLNEKLLAVDAEIALADEEMVKLEEMLREERLHNTKQ